MEQCFATPLAARLGFKPGMRVWFHAMPSAVRDAIDPDRAALEEMGCVTDGVQAVHLFATERDHLCRELKALRTLLAPNGFIWVSWPEPGSASLDGPMVRALADAHGLVEQDRCSPGEGWEGMKLVPQCAGAEH